MAALLLTAGVADGQSTPPSSPTPINPICEMAFRQVLAAAEASPRPSEADGALAESDDSGPLLDETVFDVAIRSCSSLEEFIAAAAIYPDLFDDSDPRVLLASRCWDRHAGLEGYATCQSFERFFATPAPTPTPTASATQKPDRQPAPTSTPKSPKVIEKADLSPPRSGLARVPANFRAKVRGADRTRYFAIRGKTPNALMSNAQRSARGYCSTHRAIACVRTSAPTRWRTRTDRATGKCTITSVSNSLRTVAYMPRWAAPKRVPRYMVWWWKKVVTRVGWHEAQHVRIAEEHLARFPKLVGTPCGQAKRKINKWHAALSRAQAKFDRTDYPRGDAAAQRWYLAALNRFGPSSPG